MSDAARRLIGFAGEIYRAFDEGRLFLLRSNTRHADLIHVMSHHAGGEIRGYWRPLGSTEKWKIHAHDTLGEWPELDAVVERLIAEEGGEW